MGSLCKKRFYGRLKAFERCKGAGSRRTSRHGVDADNDIIDKKLKENGKEGQIAILKARDRLGDFCHSGSQPSPGN